MTVAPASRAWRAATNAVATGISNCSNTTSASATMSRRCGESSVRCALAPGATTIMFSPPAPTTTTAVPLGTGSVTTPVGSDAVGAQVVEQRPARRVVADRGHQRHVGAGPRGGHGLVAALTAGQRSHRRRQHRLTGARQRRDVEHQV